jgi:hypothetical protein
MFVPSLSWQNDHLYTKTDEKYRFLTCHAKAFHLPVMIHHSHHRKTSSAQNTHTHTHVQWDCAVAEPHLSSWQMNVYSQPLKTCSFFHPDDSKDMKTHFASRVL